MAPLEHLDELELARMDRDLPLASTMAFRTLAQNELDKENEKYGQRQGLEPAASSWFSYLYLGAGKVAAEQVDDAGSLLAEIEVTPEERLRLQRDLAEGQGTYEV
jgi:hypothetical protein